MFRKPAKVMPIQLGAEYFPRAPASLVAHSSWCSSEAFPSQLQTQHHIIISLVISTQPEAQPCSCTGSSWDPNACPE